MAGPVPQSGAIVACPQCGTEVMQKEMIPIGVLDGVVSYVCVACARTMLRTGANAPAPSAPDPAEA